MSARACAVNFRNQAEFFEEIAEKGKAISSDNIEEPRIGVYEAEQIKRIPQILMDRIDAPPSITELARELLMNTTTMKQGFKNIFGSPIYAYHRNMCLDLAAAMLLDTKKPVFEIAVDVGYSCSVNFCYAFKKRYGISPGQYRKNGKLPYDPRSAG
jgi:AraC-like DNA-binding protein